MNHPKKRAINVAVLAEEIEEGRNSEEEEKKRNKEGTILFEEILSRVTATKVLTLVPLIKRRLREKGKTNIPQNEEEEERKKKKKTPRTPISHDDDFVVD